MWTPVKPGSVPQPKVLPRRPEVPTEGPPLVKLFSQHLGHARKSEQRGSGGPSGRLSAKGFVPACGCKPGKRAGGCAKPRIRSWTAAPLCRDPVRWADGSQHLADNASCARHVQLATL